MKTSSVGASPSRGNGGTVRRQLLKKLKQSPDGGETLDRRQLLAALAELKRGSFDVRLPDGWIGLDGKIADAFNDVVALNQRMSRELERLRRVVGQEGRIAERADIGDVGGSWGASIRFVNALIGDLVHPTSETARVIGAVAKGDLSHTMALQLDGRALQGEFLRTAKTVNRMLGRMKEPTAPRSPTARSSSRHARWTS